MAVFYMQMALVCRSRVVSVLVFHTLGRKVAPSKPSPFSSGLFDVMCINFWWREFRSDLGLNDSPRLRLLLGPKFNGPFMEIV